MKKTAFWLCVLIASLACAPAQVVVEIRMEQEQFLAGEAMPVAVRIANRSGQPLRLGAAEDWLTFTIEPREGTVVSKLGEAPVVGEFVIEPSKVAIKRVDLAPYFALSEAGHYSVTATVRIKQWGNEVVSQPKAFNITYGTKLAEHDVGLPNGANASPDVRHYILQQTSYLKGQLKLHLRVTDASGKVYCVFPVGPVVTFGQPEHQVDKSSNFHLLHQAGATAFYYHYFNSEGKLLARQTYDYVGSRPHLRADEAGNIRVVGGVRRVTPNDVPAPDKPANPSDEVEPPKP